MLRYITKTILQSDEIGFFQNKDVVYFKKVKFLEINAGDVVLVKRMRVQLVQKVVYKAATYLLAESGKENELDIKIRNNQVIGKAMFIERKGEKIELEAFYSYRSLLYLKELIRVKKELVKQNINFLFLKGLPIHLYYEGTYPRRVYRDCDILVAKKDFLKTIKALRKIGYTGDTNALPKIKDKLKEQNYLKSIKGVKIILDIHKDVVFITSRSKIGYLYPESNISKLTNIFLGEKAEIEVYGEKFPALSKENFFIYSSLHLFNHNYVGTFRYELIKNILMRNKIDFQLIESRINEYNLKNFVFPLILFLEKYYHLDFPTQFKKNIKPNKKVLFFIKKTVMKNKIFNDINIAHNDKIRIKYHFHLCPSPIYLRVFAFLNIKTLLKLL